MGHDVGSRAAGLAHRVQRAGAARARHDDRPPRRRHRPDLPAPRVRAGAVRGGHRRAVRQALDAHGADQQGRRQDVEEPRQPRVRRQAAHRVRPDGDPAGVDRAPLPHRMGVGRRADAAQRRAARGVARRRRRRRRRSCSTRSASGSTTISTRPARSRRSIAPPRGASRRRAAAALLGVLLARACELVHSSSHAVQKLVPTTVTATA